MGEFVIMNQENQAEALSNWQAEITIPAQDVYIAATLDFTETLVGFLGFDTDESQHIRAGLEEVIDFIKRVALAGQNNAPLIVSFEPRVDGLVVRINEKGLPMDVAQIVNYSIKNLWENIEHESLNLFLARVYWDHVVFHNRGRGGIEAELIKRRSKPSASVMISPDAPESPSQNTPVPVTKYTIRPFQEKEAVEISRCAYLTYGYTYEDYIYYPERIVEMNRSGELHSLVAVNDSGDVMGHCALKFSDQRKDRAEIGVLFVRPDYRKQGLGAVITKATIDLGRELNLDSIYARSVTGHRASQSMAEHYGFNDFALMLALFPRAVDLKKMGGLLKEKMSGVFQWLKLKHPRARTVYLPPRYAGIILELYRRAEIPVKIGDTGAVIPNVTRSLFNVYRIVILNVGILEIGAIGPSIETAMNWLDGNFRCLCREKMDVVYLYLNFEEPDSIAIVEHCIQRGFIFSGVAPDAFAGGDAILMQYLNLPEDPFANLTVWTDTAALLRDFIQEERNKLETSY